MWVALDDMVAVSDERLASTVEGERRLMIAVLAHALRSVFHEAGRPGRGAARRLRQDLGWFNSGDRSDPFSFERICEALEIDADLIRSRVLSDLGLGATTPAFPPAVFARDAFAPRRTSAHA